MIAKKGLHFYSKCACFLNCKIHILLPYMSVNISSIHIQTGSQAFQQWHVSSGRRQHSSRYFSDSIDNYKCLPCRFPAIKRSATSAHRVDDTRVLKFIKICDDKAYAVEHHLHEFGSLQYHIQSFASEPRHAYLSISTPILSMGSSISHGLPHDTMETVKGICPEVIEIIEPARTGYQLTLKLNFANFPRKKDAVKIITEISSVQAVILSSQLRQVLRNVNEREISQGTYKPIKLVYHPREPFYVVKQPAKLTAVFPIRFREDADVVIAKAFFQELVDVGSSGACAKAPPCYWSPIPPPELRGESIKDLSTNAGFVSFDISSRHVQGKKLDKTVWNLLNFNALVKYHVKCTKAFVQRRMRSRLENLVEALEHTGIEEDRVRKVKGRKGVRKLVKFTRCNVLMKRWNLTKKIKRIRSRIRIRGFSKFRRRWLKLPSFSSVMSYQKLPKY